MGYEELPFDEYEEFTGLPYGIKPRVVYYRCLRCGKLVSSEELAILGDIMCPHCGYRILVKVRPPPDVGPRRRIKAI